MIANCTVEWVSLKTNYLAVGCAALRRVFINITVEWSVHWHILRQASEYSPIVIAVQQLIRAIE